MNIVIPKTPDDFSKYYLLRYNLLRKPWKQLPGSEKDKGDDSAIHRMIVNPSDGEVLAVGMIQFNTNKEAQIRYMAVSECSQGRGLGTQMIESLESIAKEEGAVWIILQAREKAIKFYEKNEYKIIKKTHLLFNEIQHWLMQKEI